MLRVIARSSRLSQLQVQEAMAQFPEIDYTLETLSSYGDQHQHISLLNGEAPADMFTRELDEALILGRADVAIHSAKDLPYPLDHRLEVIALFPPIERLREGERSTGMTSDSLVSRDHLTLAQLPPGSTVGTSSPMRRRELLALRPDLQVVSIRGCIEERVRQVRDGAIDAAIVATCALKRLGMEADISQELPFETHPLQGYLAVTALRGRSELPALFERHDALRRQGHVTLVGFGPGDPELLTVKAVKTLRQADIIYYDDLIGQAYLDTLPAEKVYVGKRSGHHHAEQPCINRQLLHAARQGKQVVRLKGGDPMVFGHAGEEIEYLQSNLVSVSVVPGITTASALAATTRVSLTHRGVSSSVALVNGHADSPVVPSTDTIVYYMGGSRLGPISRSLLFEGWPATTPVLLVHNVSLPDEQTLETTLGDLSPLTSHPSPLNLPTPVIALVGDVARLRHQPSTTLRRTLYTGLVCPSPDYIHTPLIAIEPVSFTTPPLDSYDYLLFTSRHAVKAFLSGEFRVENGEFPTGLQTGSTPSADSRAVANSTLYTLNSTLPERAAANSSLFTLHSSLNSLHSTLRVVSIGPTTTQALKEAGISQVDQVQQADSHGVIDYFSRQSCGRVLIPRSNLALDIIPDGLRSLGFTVQTLTVYRTVYPRHVRRVNLDNIRRVVFTSPSTVDNFLKTYGTLPPHIEYVTRGSTTAAHLRQVVQSLK